MSKLKNRVLLKSIPLKQANDIWVRYHYLHRKRIMAQLAYGIFIDDKLTGAISFAYPMGSFPLHNCRPLEMLELARMYLFNHIPHLASCAIGKALRRIKEDWSKKYPHHPTPKLIVSWSDNTRHEGTIYKASNFTKDGDTKGGRNGRIYRRKKTSHQGKNRKDFKHSKTRWIYFLR